MRTAQLLAAEDTRAQARAWIETHVPAGTTCCNFGGWSAGVSVQTFEKNWSRAMYFERSFDRQQLDQRLEFLDKHRPPAPFYSYAVQSGSRQFENGNMELVDTQKCAYAILHRHPLSFSTVNASFATELADRGELKARFVPAGLLESAPRYDPNDAYYVPLGDYGSLRHAWSRDRDLENEGPCPVRERGVDRRRDLRHGLHKGGFLHGAQSREVFAAHPSCFASAGTKGRTT